MSSNSPPSPPIVPGDLLQEELSSSTLAALMEFLAETRVTDDDAAAVGGAAAAAAVDNARDAASGAADAGGGAAAATAGAVGNGQGYGPTEMSLAAEERLFREDWGMSQFWYDDGTADAVAEEVLRVTRGGEVPAVCVACPTLFRRIRRKAAVPQLRLQLLEYDRRFAAFGDAFTFYDYRQPLALPQHLHHSFPVVIADPPYLSAECLEKTAETIQLLLPQHHDGPTAEQPECVHCADNASDGPERGASNGADSAAFATQPDSHVLLLTGAVQETSAWELLRLRPCRFRPQHKSKLGNDFRIFTSYDPPSQPLGGWQDSVGAETSSA